MNYYITDNRAGCVPIDRIPVVEYAALYTDLCERLADEHCHLAHYFALPDDDGRLYFYVLLLDDASAEVLIARHAMEYYAEQALPSLTAQHAQAHPFEREIAERYGVHFEGMPWPKPLRYPFDRVRQSNTIDNYPFYTMEGTSLHEVNVGPIHAGVIEPGAFRFICNGEQVLHLEIVLGYQHRGVEHQLTSTGNRLRQTMLAEAVAGDSAVAHATAFAEALRKLAGHASDPALDHERAIALELERMAMQIADTGALCMDIAYQLGQVACEALRTMTINTTQAWCGNRFGKGLIRPLGTNHPLTAEKVAMIRQNVSEIRRRFAEVCRDLENSPSLLARFEQCGAVPRIEMQRIGGVGQAARASGLKRDIRASHPWGAYASGYKPVLRTEGDVMARLGIRCAEVIGSADRILQLLDTHTTPAASVPDYTAPLAPRSLAFGLIEGWRGETCHVAVTDADGSLIACRVKDPSLHNWMALALAVRGEGISDFPICNKSFNLSYCGHDL